jgi:hypothetical protein
MNVEGGLGRSEEVVRHSLLLRATGSADFGAVLASVEPPGVTNFNLSESIGAVTQTEQNLIYSTIS